mgnify:CR=1 FL=1
MVEIVEEIKEVMEEIEDIKLKILSDLEYI